MFVAVCSDSRSSDEKIKVGIREDAAMVDENGVTRWNQRSGNGVFLAQCVPLFLLPMAVANLPLVRASG